MPDAERLLCVRHVANNAALYRLVKVARPAIAVVVFGEARASTYYQHIVQAKGHGHDAVPLRLLVAAVRELS